MPEPTRPFAIATPHLAATAAGRAAFEAGGNAVDAALAAACALTVVYPHMCAVGGDVMALVHDGRAHAVNGSGRAARRLRRMPCAAASRSAVWARSPCPAPWRRGGRWPSAGGRCRWHAP